VRGGRAVNIASFHTLSKLCGMLRSAMPRTKNRKKKERARERERERERERREKGGGRRGSCKRRELSAESRAGRERARKIERGIARTDRAKWAILRGLGSS